MAANAYTIPVTISPAPPAGTVVLVDFTTVDDSATAFTDYMVARGTLRFSSAVTTVHIHVPVLADPTALVKRSFNLRLSNVRNATFAGSPAPASEVVACPISGPPAVTPVSWPGPRVALIGDSITFINSNHVPGTAQGSYTRYENYNQNENGYLIWAKVLSNGAIEFEHGLQPNTNPNGQDPHNGYNFGVYSSQTSQWVSASFDPLGSADTVGSGGLGGGTSNIGPVLNALAYINSIDVIVMMGGTNDLSAGASAQSVLNNLMTYAYELAQHGKYVFVVTVTPRTADALQQSAGGSGYNQAQVQAVMQNILTVNAGLRSWLGGTPVPNIFLVDPWAALVGPTASIVPGTPTDPAGMLSPSSGITSGALIPSTVGTNFRTDAPGAIMMYDGLHPSTPAAEIIGRELLAAFTAAGMPAGTPGKRGPLTVGPALNANTAMTVSTTPRSAGQPLLLGRAIGLGAPLGTATGTGHQDQYTNYGQGYTYGPMPDRFFFYRCSNSDNESYSNFSAFTFSSSSDSTTQPYMVDSTWAPGAVTTSIVTYNGAPALKIVCNIPSGLTHNEGFQLQYFVGEGQHGPWDNYGFETGSTATYPAPPYAPGDAVSGSCTLAITGLGSSKLTTCKLTLGAYTVVPGDSQSTGSVVQGQMLSEGFFPFDAVKNTAHHPDDKVLYLSTPAVLAPTPPATATNVYLQMCLDVTFDASAQAGTATFVVSNWQINKITGGSAL